MMTKTHKGVELLVLQEYDLASEQHGERFHSPHEAYAVILEEVQEADRAEKFTEGSLHDFWIHVRKDEKETELCLSKLRGWAMNAASEFIQVAAMAHKAMQGYEMEKKDENKV